ncbi:spore coat protein [Robertmurraya sp. DFI.2.37]|jgi:spore coat protein CotF|uniref:spore coat protein n=1 Tax=Robertmurraya sp. DFI.2.37 TaxID=3031819 RepID=UPI001248D8B5|nr:spore coat protein [Robertmurraya sp. DFI.2.37]MDF1509079.1 spore coat protein [Robertmurraya sp. DFI.2.37]
MNEDYLDPKYAEGMPKMADSSVALDFLLTIKTGIRYYAVALTETASSTLRETLFKQLDAAIDLYEETVQLLLEKGWLYPHDLGKQIELDLKSADMALAIAEMELFPRDTDRLGTFATPFK